MSQTYTTNFAICPANSSHPFRIDPLAKTSIFTGVKTREYPNLELIYGFLNHKLGISYQNIARYKCVPYKTEQNQLTAYLGLLDKNAGCIVTKWSLPAHGWGRILPDRHLSLSVMHRPTRHALCEGRYLDFDIVNAHPAFLLDLVRRESPRSSLSCAYLAEYVADPKAIRAQIMEHYGVTKDVAKSLPIRIINGGSIKSWKLENGVSLQTDLPLMVGLEKELKPIIEAVWRDNQQIHVDISNAKQDKSDQYVTKSLKAKKRTIMATWAQTIERCIQERAIAAILDEYGIQIEDIVPCQDGIMPKICYAPYADEIIRKMEAYVHEQLGILVKWILKPFDEANRQIPAESELSIGKPAGTVAFDNDRDVAEHIYEKIKAAFKYCRGNYYMRMENFVWTSDLEQIKRALVYTVNQSNVFRPGREEGTYVPYTQNFQAAKNISSLLLGVAVHDESFGFETEMFQSSLGFTLFKNGYLDWRENYFVPLGHDEFDDRIIFNEYIPYDFELLTVSLEEAQLIKTNMEFIKEQLFYTPFGREMGDYYILNLARAMAGDCMKRFLFGIGASNTGKSLITSAIKSACGGYYGGFNGQNLTYKSSSQDEAQLLRWAMLLRHKRIIISNEIKKGTPIDGNCIKKLANGGLDDLTGRGHGGNETNFKVAFLPICFANDIDQIKPYDDAVEIRVRAIPYTKVCVDKPESEIDPRYEIKRDVTLMSEIETPEFRMAFISVLVEAYVRFNAAGRPEIEPERVRCACAETFGENRPALDMFLDEYELTGSESDFVASADIQSWVDFHKIDVSITKLTTEFKKYADINGIVGVQAKSKKISGKLARGWVGLRLISEDLLESS